MPIDRRGFRNSSKRQANEGVLSVLPVLGGAIWQVMPLISPRSAQALSISSTAIKSLLAPASERAARTAQLERELRSLPFDYKFALHLLGPQVLRRALSLLAPLQPLKRRELAGRDAGWVPTEGEHWCFHSHSELEAITAAVHLAARDAGPSPLLLSATMRLDYEQTTAGPLWTAPVGLEWAGGPAADPLQLGLRVGIGPGDHAEIDLEFVSGGWSPWAETWTLNDGTLVARVTVIIAIPGREPVIIKKGVSSPEVAQDFGRRSCDAEGLEAVKEALAAAGAEGVRAVVCLGALDWQKDPPVWCPEEVQRATVTPKMVNV
mmetsp:Transcript_142083/g.247620  ORF Transcript_142083/g.247620 Transcript_142083/m.247620 type:complete len:320 (-) Transcript_142083:26-985(-)